MLKAPLPQKTQRELVPEGNYPARIYELIELGTIEGSWMGEVKFTHKVRIGFELPTEKRVFDEKKGEQPFVISKEMALSFGDLAGLRKVIEAVEGKKLTDAEAVDYDVETILGKPLLVTVKHSEPTQEGVQYANVAVYSPLIKGLTVEPLTNKIKLLTFEKWDDNLFQSLPDFLKEKIQSSPEYKNRGKFEMPTVKVDTGEAKNVEDIPF